MKKSTCLIVSFLLLALNAYAQTMLSPQPDITKGNITFWGGITSSKVTCENDIFTYGPFENSKIGLSFGVTTEIYFYKHFSVETGLLYLQSGGAGEKMKGTDAQKNVLGEYYFVQNLQYFQIPLSLKFNTDFSLVQPFFLVGPNLGILLTAHERIKADYEESIEYSKSVIGKLTKYNPGFDIGFGFKLPLTSQLNIAMMWKYSLGLQNQVKDAVEGAEQKSKDSLFLSGLSYNF